MYKSLITIFMLTFTSCLSTNKEAKNNNIFKDYDIINFGEYHGTKEMPHWFLSKVKDYSLKNKDEVIYFGIEIPKSEKQYIKDFVRTGDEKFLSKSSFFTKAYQDGRSSAAIAEALKSFKGIKNLEVFCFDQELPYNSKRDQIMAKNILEKFKEKSNIKIFTYSGNLHPRKKLGTPWDKKFKSMGLFIEELSSKKTLSIRGEFKSGESWSCSGMTDDTCGVKKVGSIDSSVATSKSITKSATVKNGYDAFVLFEKVSASRPLIINMQSE